LGTRGLAPPSTPRPRGMYRRRPRRRCRLPYLVNSSSRSASFKSLHNLGLGGKVANRSVGRYFGGCGGVGRRARDVSVSCGRPFAKSRSSPARSAWRNKPSFLVALSLTVSFIFHVMFFSALVLSLLSFFTPSPPPRYVGTWRQEAHAESALAKTLVRRHARTGSSLGPRPRRERCPSRCPARRVAMVDQTMTKTVLAVDQTMTKTVLAVYYCCPTKMPYLMRVLLH